MTDAPRVLDLTPGADGPFAHERDAIVSRLLRRGAPIPDRAPAPLSADFAPAAVALARENWRHKMVREHDSAALFAALAPQLMAAGLPVGVHLTCLRAAMDELHHGDLCARAVVHLGGQPQAPAPPRPPLLPAHAAAPPLEAALRNALFIGCLSETVAVGLLARQRQQIAEPFIAAINRQLLGDETLHARLGWEVLTLLLPRLDAPALARTHRYLSVAFAAYEAELLTLTAGPPPPADVLEQARALGFTDGAAARQTFDDVRDHVIVPRLHSLGLDASAAWRDRHAAASPRP